VFVSEDDSAEEEIEYDEDGTYIGQYSNIWSDPRSCPTED
jgi:hypothetical protein